VATIPSPVDGDRCHGRLLALDDARLYVGDGCFFEIGPWHLRVLDVGSPQRPLPLARLPLEEPTSRIWASGDRVSLFTRAGPFIPATLVNVDVSDPAWPTVVLHHRLDWLTYDLVRDADSAYAVAEVEPSTDDDPFGRIQRLDVSVPSTVTLRASVDLDVSSHALALGADVLWAAVEDPWTSANPAVERFALAAQGAPQPTGRLSLPSEADALTAVGRLLLARGKDSGLLVIDPDQTPPTPTPTNTALPPTPTLTPGPPTTPPGARVRVSLPWAQR
jgi:hypothetical protein